MKTLSLVLLTVLVHAHTALARDIDQLNCKEKKHGFIHLTINSDFNRSDARLIDGYAHARYVCPYSLLERIKAKSATCYGMFMYGHRPTQVHVFRNQAGKIQAVVEKFYGGISNLECEIRKLKVD